jgi:hypothetical protein
MPVMAQLHLLRMQDLVCKAQYMLQNLRVIDICGCLLKGKRLKKAKRLSKVLFING